MRPAHPVEEAIGIAWYTSETDGIGGHLKQEPADFRVTEREGIDPQPLSADPGAYPHVIVRVELTGWDTFDFASRLAHDLDIHRGAIDWAGTKDKEAITTQLFSIKGIVPDDLPSIPHTEITPVGRFGRGLTFGDLLGNTFRIRVRNASNPARHVPITDELHAFGSGEIAIPNFFGHQRFGSRRPITHSVGLGIIAGDWERAVMQYLGSPSDREPVETQQARSYIEETYDWEGGLERMPRGLGHERRMLSALREADRDDEDAFQSALDRLPEQLRRLFVHAAQSYLFNRVVSARREAGLPFTEAVKGDTVCFATVHDELGPLPDPHRTQRVTADRVDTINRHIRNGRAFVTAPLVGTESTLGNGDPDALVRTVLEEIDVEPADFDLPDPYNSRGTVRPLVVYPDLRIDSDPLVFSFNLPSGSYATVVMREYLKTNPDAMS